jgi:hypothetical protein
VHVQSRVTFVTPSFLPSCGHIPICPWLPACQKGRPACSQGMHQDPASGTQEDLHRQNEFDKKVTGAFWWYGNPAALTLAGTADWRGMPQCNRTQTHSVARAIHPIGVSCWLSFVLGRNAPVMSAPKTLTLSHTSSAAEGRVFFCKPTTAPHTPFLCCKRLQPEQALGSPFAVLQLVASTASGPNKLLTTFHVQLPIHKTHCSCESTES